MVEGETVKTLFVSTTGSSQAGNNIFFLFFLGKKLNLLIRRLGQLIAVKITHYMNYSKCR